MVVKLSWLGMTLDQRDGMGELPLQRPNEQINKTRTQNTVRISQRADDEAGQKLADAALDIHITDPGPERVDLREPPELISALRP